MGSALNKIWNTTINAEEILSQGEITSSLDLYNLNDGWKKD
jgi:hypothetical protein